MICREKHSRELGKILKEICKHNSRSPVLKATAICPITAEVTTIIKTQEEIVKAAAKSNVCCQ